MEIQDGSAKFEVRSITDMYKEIQQLQKEVQVAQQALIPVPLAINNDYILGVKVEILDSFFKDAPHESTPVWFLGKSLEVLSKANLAYFIGDWKNYRGCKIENTVAHEYGIDTIEE